MALKELKIEVQYDATRYLYGIKHPGEADYTWKRAEDLTPEEGIHCGIHIPAQPRESSYPQTRPLHAIMRELIGHIEPKTNDRHGLTDTPSRAAKAWDEWTSGYGKDASDILKLFDDGAEGCDEMIVVKDIPFYSHCEHHLAPIFGHATIGYLPSKRIVGLSKLSRLVDIYARRLQVQERMTNEIADALCNSRELAPRGVGVVLNARHFCMESRGIRQAGTVTVTSAMRGLFRNDATVRAEFLALARKE